MSRMYDKPDLAAWAEQLHTLINEGSQPARLDDPDRDAGPARRTTARSKP